MSSAYDRLPLNALRVFEAVATRLNFTDAAEALHVTPAAVSQQVKALEDYLQTPLLRRNGRGVQLTIEGARLLPGLRRGLDELEAALQQIRQERETGRVNVSTLSSFLQKWLTPRLIDLHKRHPDIDFHIHASAEVIDFARTDFHAAVRLGSGHYPGLHTEKILDEHLVAVASPDVLAKYGPLSSWSELDKLPLLHGTETDWSRWFSGETDCLKALRGAFLDDSAALLSAAIEGLGFGILRWTLAAGELQAGRIVLASQRVLPYRYAYYFVCPEAYLALPKVVALRDWLLQQAGQFESPPDVAQPQRAPTGTRGTVPQPTAALQTRASPTQRTPRSKLPRAPQPSRRRT
jgi:LysR family transcriptional regulator, glycine cleavage system transcriptional activator